MKFPKTILGLFLLVLFSCSTNKIQNLKVLQFNIWQEGTQVKNGYKAVINEIINSKADLIALSEVRNYNNLDLNKRLILSLEEEGFTFYAEKSNDTGLLSKFPIIEQTALFPVTNDHGSITKAIINVNGVEIAFYSGHLDYLNCALYLPRGYNGSTWKKLPKPITNIKEINAINLASQRDEAIKVFIEDSLSEIKKGRIIIYAGDNNEPSHLDWVEENKNLYDHNGVVINWTVTGLLEQNNFIDSYRKLYPNPITHPGFTFPANNTEVPIKKLAWSPDADDRDRIDFIYYHPDKRLKLINSKIIGPIGDIVKNERVKQITSDAIISPIKIWPSDHKAVLSEFTLLLN